MLFIRKINLSRKQLRLGFAFLFLLTVIIFSKFFFLGLDVDTFRYVKNYLYFLVFLILIFVFIKEKIYLKTFYLSLVIAILFGSLIYFISDYNYYDSRSVGTFANPNVLSFIALFVYFFSNYFYDRPFWIKVMALLALFSSGSISSLLMFVLLFLADLYLDIKKTNLKKGILTQLRIHLTSGILFLLLLIFFSRLNLLYRYLGMLGLDLTPILEQIDQAMPHFISDETRANFHFIPRQIKEVTTSASSRVQQIQYFLEWLKSESFWILVLGEFKKPLYQYSDIFHINWIRHFGLLNYFATFYFMLIMPLKKILTNQFDELKFRAAVFLVCVYTIGMSFHYIYEEAPSYLILGVVFGLLLFDKKSNWDSSLQKTL